MALTAFSCCHFFCFAYGHLFFRGKRKWKRGKTFERAKKRISFAGTSFVVIILSVTTIAREYILSIQFRLRFSEFVGFFFP